MPALLTGLLFAVEITAVYTNWDVISIQACYVQNHLLDGDSRRGGCMIWNTVRYMIARIQYGGRITDKFDQTLMDSYTSMFFNEVRDFFASFTTASDF